MSRPPDRELDSAYRMAAIAETSTGSAKTRGWEKVACWASLIGAMAVVLWVRTVPLGLPEVQRRADRLLQQQIAARLASEGEPGPAAALLSEEQIEASVSKWIEAHRGEFETMRTTLSNELGALLRYEGANRREYVYLGDADSYSWLRKARNYMRTGTTCDAVVDGVCRDTYANAPVGARMKYGRSVHIAAIVALHRLFTLFDPAYPLPASAFWVPVILGVACVLPAFFLVRRLSGLAGGLAAALWISLQPMLLIRSIGSDNDVWNVALPLFTVWLVVAALDASTRWRRVALALLAAVVLTIHAASWRGWILTYVVVLAGLLASVLLDSVRHVSRTGELAIWRARSLQRTSLVGLAFVAGTLLGTAASGVDAGAGMIFSMWSKVSGASKLALPETHYWPDVFSTVAELARPDLQRIAESLGGNVAFLGALLGLVLLLRAPKLWGRLQMVAASSLMAAVLFYLLRENLHRNTAVPLLALPVLALSFLRTADEDDDTSGSAAALMIVLWFFAALYLAFGALRFVLLIGPVHGIGLGLVVGRGGRWIRNRLRALSTGFRSLGTAVLVGALGLTLAYPIQRGYAIASGYIPAMNDSWWDTLTKIRDDSPTDTIVNAWWDYGYWIKYVAERRVTADGGTARSRALLWLAKALLAPSERESAGLLRMLNCGSDVTSGPEELRGAFGKIRNSGRDDLLAYGIVLDLARLDRREAMEYLARQGFSTAEQEDILRSTHCSPPESLLIVSGEQLADPDAWMRLGLWDLRGAFISKQLQKRTADDVAGDLVERGYSEQSAGQLVAQEVNRSIGSGFRLPPYRRNSEWLPCRPSRRGLVMVCPVGALLGDEGHSVDAFAFDPTFPAGGKLHVRLRRDDGTFEERRTSGSPAAIVVAGSVLDDVVSPDPTFPDVAVLVDVANQRILVGAPALIRSTLVHLIYLDGRYAKHFRKVDERAAGYRVSTWQLR